jgi:hypothetical protein
MNRHNTRPYPGGNGIILQIFLVIVRTSVPYFDTCSIDLYPEDVSGDELGLCRRCTGIRPSDL